MSKGITVLMITILAAFASQAQNVGIGTSTPLNKLQVNGSVLFISDGQGTGTLPTAGQTKTMGETSFVGFPDSTGRIYDPGGTGNYGANSNVGIDIAQYLTIDVVGIEISFEDFDLGTGDSLHMSDGSTSYVFSSSVQPAGRYTFNNLEDFPIRFESNADASVGRGFSIIWKFLFNKSDNLKMQPGVGNVFLYDSKKGALRTGLIRDTVFGQYSVGLMGGTARGSNSIAIGNGATAPNTLSVAIGSSASAGGFAAMTFGYGDADGERAVSVGNGHANGRYSVAAGYNSQSNGQYSFATGNQTNGNGYSSFVAGMFNDPVVSAESDVNDNTPLFIIGNGNSGAARSNALLIRKSGKIGIGTNDPATRLHVDNGQDASYEPDAGYMVIGSSAGLNVVYDNNEILARNNGAAGGLSIQNNGGNLSLCNLGGMVSIGAVSPSYQLQVATNSAAKPTSGTWTVVSDARLKKDIRDYRDGLNELMKVHPVWFTHTGEAGMPKETGVGVLAQELKTVAPYMVGDWKYTGKDGKTGDFLSVDNGAMTYMLINAVKEQQQMIEALKNENQQIKTLLEKILSQQPIKK